LRHVRAVLRIAHEWKYLTDMPRVRMVKEPTKLPTYVTPEDFAAIYAACEQAKKPRDIAGIDSSDWWRVCHAEREAADGRRTAKTDAAQELFHDAALH
jgi:hypothetical protein